MKKKKTFEVKMSKRTVKRREREDVIITTETRNTHQH